jgi:hypothetical protein
MAGASLQALRTTQETQATGSNSCQWRERKRPCPGEP